MGFHGANLCTHIANRVAGKTTIFGKVAMIQRIEKLASYVSAPEPGAHFNTRVAYSAQLLNRLSRRAFFSPGLPYK